METRIVDFGIKIDLHIHSATSASKDGSLVKEGTKQNVEVLVEKLRTNHIDMFSITDHDAFDFELYDCLKKREGIDFKKILPGVEFSVGIESGKTPDDHKEVKQVHVIAIFDDFDSGKLQQLEKLLKQNKYDVKSKQNIKANDLYSEKTFREILQKSNLNICLIAHQKQSPLSEKQKAPDAMALGREKFNELINYEYFESYEFKTENNRIFHNLFKKQTNEKYQRVRFITGSDCHVWNLYPKHDATDNTDFIPTYLKCLPSFRGLAMALTDDSRIQQNPDFFSESRNCLPNISYRENGKEHVIPLSKGINAIIGDNSKGKSMFLHAITNYDKSNSGHGTLPVAKRDGYKKYLEDHDIEILTNLIGEKLEFEFDSQGEIRAKFEGGSAFSSFIEGKKPDSTDSSIIVNSVKEAFAPLYESLRTKFYFDKKIQSIKGSIFKLDTIGAVGLSLNVSSIPSSKREEIKKLSKFLGNLKKAKNNIEDSLKYNLDNGEKDILVKMVSDLSSLIEKYEKINLERTWKNGIIDGINTGITTFLDNQKTVQNEAESKWTMYKRSVSDFANLINETVSLKEIIKPFEFKMEPVDPEYKQKRYGGLVLINRFSSNRKSYDSDYCISLLKRVFKIKSDLNKFLDIPAIDEKRLLEMIKDKDDAQTNDAVKMLETKINELIQKDFENEEAIIENGADVTKNYSAGFNAAKYFNLMSYDESHSIYIIDQPEDDISQKSIRETVVSDLKRMAKTKQIILVTHNPQFVINLDVDNVLYFHNDDKGSLSIESGALEFKNEQFDTLKCVSDNLEGGIESLKKRWKRYEKNIENDL